MTTPRDQILKVLLPLFPEVGSAGVYTSKKLNAEMGVAGNQIIIEFYEKPSEGTQENSLTNK